MNRIILIILIFSSSLTAQTIFGIRGGVSKQHPVDDPNPNPSTWHAGVDFGAQVDQHIWNALFLSGSLEFSLHKYRNYVFRGITIPEIRPIGSTGENSHIMRFSLEGKLTTLGPEAFRILFVTGATLIREDQGDLSVTFEDMNNGTFVVHHKNRPRLYFAHSLGLGIQSFFSEQWGIEVTARFYSDYSERFDSTVAGGLVYRLY